MLKKQWAQHINIHIIKCKIRNYESFDQKDNYVNKQHFVNVFFCFVIVKWNYYFVFVGIVKRNAIKYYVDMWDYVIINFLYTKLWVWFIHVFTFTYNHLKTIK